MYKDKIENHEKKYDYKKLCHEFYQKEEMRNRFLVKKNEINSKEFLETFKEKLKEDESLKEGILLLPEFIPNDLCEYFINTFEFLDSLQKTNQPGHELWALLTDEDEKYIKTEIKDASQFIMSSLNLKKQGAYNQRLRYYYLKMSQAAAIYFNKFQPWRTIGVTTKTGKKKIPFTSSIIRDQFDASYLLCKRYNPPDQGYHIFHEDWNKSRTEKSLRYWVVMCYLNDVKNGGETEFLYQGRLIKPKKGTIVVFPPYYTHLHKGHPPKSNSKYILTSWLLPKTNNWGK